MNNISNAAVALLDFVNPPERYRAIIYRAGVVAFLIGVGVAVLLGHSLADTLIALGLIFGFVNTALAAFNTSLNPPEPSPADQIDA